MAVGIVTVVSKKVEESMKYSAFKAGFLKGAFSPFMFFSPDEIHRPSRFNGSAEKAWADVFFLLSDAMKEQGKYIEQETGKKTKAR